MDTPALAAVFERVPPLTIGIEEEVLLLDPQTLEPVPCADDILRRFQSDPRFKAELPAAQIELVTSPHTCADAAVAELAAARRDLVAITTGIVAPAASGVSPLGSPFAVLADDPRYAHTRERYGKVAHLQLVGALQVHVAVGGAARTLAVHNALRSYLPELAALAANGPLLAGSDTGLASARPLISRSLPRQGVPPAIESWERYQRDIAWGVASGAMLSAGQWWWELRPHPTHGTLELRVPDAQATIEDARGVAAVVHALVAWLSERVDAGEQFAEVPLWRIEENRWSALGAGVEGTMADLETGAPEPTRTRLRRLLAELQPVAGRLGCAAGLACAATLVEVNGAIRQRAAAGPDGDARAAARMLTEVFAPDAAAVPGAE